MKHLLFYSFLVVSQSVFCQDNFTLDYELVGMGSSRYSIFYPIIKVKGNDMTFTTKHTKRNVYIRQSSVDSILNFVRVIKDTVVFKSNPCILSGTATYLAIGTGRKRLKYYLANTSDLHAQKIISILNTYLPDDQKIDTSDRLIKKLEDCHESLFKLFADSTKN